jgi:hypothetical protein
MEIEDCAVFLLFHDRHEPHWQAITGDLGCILHGRMLPVRTRPTIRQNCIVAVLVALAYSVAAPFQFSSFTQCQVEAFLDRNGY